MPTIMQVVEPVIDRYIQDNTNYTQSNVDTKKTKPEGTPALEYMEDVPEDVSDVDGMQKHVALIYYAICWLFELFKKGIYQSSRNLELIVCCRETHG